ncbi:hypothetical protein GmHk_03G007960 [Glycine max]|nr:hypothetical protein GmHk_03G007960 [Glycine max]
MRESCRSLIREQSRGRRETCGCVLVEFTVWLYGDVACFDLLSLNNGQLVNFSGRIGTEFFTELQLHTLRLSTAAAEFPIFHVSAST